LFGAALWAQSLQVIDGEGHSKTITAAQIASAAHVAVDVKDHDTAATFDGVPLGALLSTAGIQFGDKLRGPRMTEVLLVEAADGYKVAFALAEVDPAFATREIIIADKRGGKPLDAKEGPLRIVVPGDKRAARWVRQVTVLRIVAVK
jgi:molybdopterin-dependent oxidoreductase-like protein protein